MQWIHRSCPPPRKNGPFCPGGGRRKFSPWKYYMKNICCYYFSSQHDAFWFFLTFLTLKNNLKRLNTKRQKKRLIFKAFLYWIFPGGGGGAGEDLTIFPGGGEEAMDSLQCGLMLWGGKFFLKKFFPPNFWSCFIAEKVTLFCFFK